MLGDLRRQVLIQLMRTKFYNWAVLDVMPKMRVSNAPTAVTGWQFRELYQALDPGDIVLTIDYRHIASMVIKSITGGQVSHAGLCVAKGEAWEISEMTQRGYTQSAFFDVCKHADRVVIANCRDWDDAYVAQVIAKSRTFVGRKYDTQFSLGVDYLACSELIYHSDFEHRLLVDLKDEAGIGRPYLSPQGILEAKNLVVKMDSAKLLPPAGLNFPE